VFLSIKLKIISEPAGRRKKEPSGDQSGLRKNLIIFVTIEHFIGLKIDGMSWFLVSFQIPFFIMTFFIFLTLSK
jgi:hypothetical protein